MNRNLTYAAGTIVLSLACFCSSEAQAQLLLMPRVGGYNNAAQEAPLPNPAVSPYLLLTDVGQSGVLNYQTLVQPLMQQRLTTNHQNASINSLQQQVQNAQTGPQQGRTGQTGRGTGRSAARYLNYSHYYSSVAQH